MRKRTTTIFAPHVNVTTPKESLSLRWARLKSRSKQEKIMSTKGQKFHIIVVTKGGSKIMVVYVPSLIKNLLLV